MLLICFVIQVSLFLYGRSVALQAAREGVSQVRLAQTGQDYDAIKNKVRGDVANFASSVGSGALNVDGANGVQPSYDDAAGRVSVTVTGTTISLVPGLKLHVTEKASGQIERFQDTG